MVKKIIYILLIGIGIFLRVYQITSLPAGLFMDEVSIAVNAKTIAQSGTDEYGRHLPFGFESVSDYKMPGYIYATAGWFKLLGPQLITVRITALLSGIISIGLLGYLLFLLFPEKKDIGFIGAVVTALCLYEIHFSRIAYESMFATMAMLLYFISFFHILKKPKHYWWYGIGAFFFILSCWTYPAPKFIMPLVTAGMLGAFLFITPEKYDKKRVLFLSLFFLGIAFIAYIPSLLHPIFDSRPISYITEGTDGSVWQILTKKGPYILSSWLRIFNFEFLFDKGDTFAYRHGTKETGIFMSIFLLPFVIGIGTFLKEFRFTKVTFVFLALLTLIAGLPSALTSETPYGPRLVPMMIPLISFVSLGVVSLLEIIEKQKQWLKIGILSFFLLMLGFQTVLFFHVYFVHFKTTSLPEFPKAETELGQFVKTVHAKSPQTKIYAFNDKSCHLWGHDDLHLWYFADLPNDTMILWNNAFRKIRYAYGSPFDAYDNVVIPRNEVNNLILYSGYDEMEKAPSGSFLIRCGFFAPTINQKTEKVVKIFYMYESVQREPYYVISQRK